MENNQFNYTYTAPTEEERKEIAQIRRQYVAEEKTESNMEKLRRLDAFVKNSATCIALILGVVGCLIFGSGMTMVLEWGMAVWGVLLGVVGAIPMAIAYPIYRFVLNRNKKKYGAEIIRLSEALLNEQTKND